VLDLGREALQETESIFQGLASLVGIFDVRGDRLDLHVEVRVSAEDEGRPLSRVRRVRERTAPV